MPIEPSTEEEKYFAAVEAEARRKLRENLEDNARRLEENTAVAAALGTDDAVLADEIRKLGFDGDNAKVFDLLPLVHVAWADGSVQRGERAAILKILRARGIEPGTSPFRTIEALLEERPADSFMRQSLALLRGVLGKRGGGDGKQEIVDLCMQVAAASGGLLGLGARMSDEEKAMIAQISLELGDGAAAVKEQL
jgi:tellurite resistance protein